MKKFKKIAILIMILIFILLFLCCSFILIRNFFDYKEIEKETTKLIDDVVEVKIDSNRNTKMTLNWEKIANTNQDIIGWIKIEDTNIDYPIMQDTNLYYMNHTYEKKYNRNGSIFTKTSNPFKTEETTIYGHNNKNGLMFADIEKFMEDKFFYDHLTFKVYTKDCVYDAKVFSIYSTGVKEETNNIKNLSFEERVEYYINKSEYGIEKFDMPTNIIKISTCSYLNNKARPTDQRYYLLAYLVENN